MGIITEQLLTTLGVREERIKIEIGKTYLTRQGQKLKAVSKDTDGGVNFKMVDENQSTPYIINNDGTYSFSEWVVERTFSLSPDEPLI